MLLTNLLAVLITIIIQMVYAYILTKNARIRNTFFHLNIIPNSFVNNTVRPYKKKVLAVSRIYLLTTLVVSILFIFLNKSILFLIIYLIIFIVGSIWAPKIAINSYINEIEKLDIILTDKNSRLKFFGLVYNDETDKNITYQYGYYKSAINIALPAGKAIIAFIAVVILALGYVSYINVSNQSKQTLTTNKVKYDLSDTEYIITYNDIVTKVDLTTMSAVAKIDKIPDVEKNLTGKQINDYRIGEFKLSAIDTPSYLVYQSKNTNIIQITTEKYTYYISYDNAKMLDEQLKLLQAKISFG